MISAVIPAYNEEDIVERCAVVTGGILREAATGVILLSLGVMGYYLGRIYRQNLGRPRYIISRECGWDR